MNNVLIGSQRRPIRARRVGVLRDDRRRAGRPSAAARPPDDAPHAGMSGVHTGMTNTKNTPDRGARAGASRCGCARCRLRRGSGGAGVGAGRRGHRARARGARRRHRVAHHRAPGQRSRGASPAASRARSGENWLLPGGDESRAERLPDKCTIRLEAGDVLRMLHPRRRRLGRCRLRRSCIGTEAIELRGWSGSVAAASSTERRPPDEHEAAARPDVEERLVDRLVERRQDHGGPFEALRALHRLARHGIGVAILPAGQSDLPDTVGEQPVAVGSTGGEHGDLVRRHAVRDRGGRVAVLTRLTSSFCPDRRRGATASHRPGCPGAASGPRGGHRARRCCGSCGGSRRAWTGRTRRSRDHLSV